MLSAITKHRNGYVITNWSRAHTNFNSPTQQHSQSAHSKTVCPLCVLFLVFLFFLLLCLLPSTYSPSLAGHLRVGPWQIVIGGLSLISSPKQIPLIVKTAVRLLSAGRFSFSLSVSASDPSGAHHQSTTRQYGRIHLKQQGDCSLCP